LKSDIKSYPVEVVERAAIMEIEGVLTREEAERKAIEAWEKAQAK
jgi:hypothetical protein